MLSLLLAQALASPFVFVGQPDCVDLSWSSGVTTLHNRCDAPLLVDAAVRPGDARVAPGQVVTLRDLSAFTLGLEGRLHQVVAQWEATGAPTPE